MKKLNFGKERTDIIIKVLGNYYANFDSDVNVYELDDKKRNEVLKELPYMWQYDDKKMISNSLKKEGFFIENIRTEGTFKYILTDIKIELGK